MDKLKLNLVVVMVMVVASFEFFPSTTATEHYVGDSFGWAEPRNEFYYNIWSINQHFRVNDVLIFKFASGAHTVAEVTLAAYDACDGSHPIQMYTAGPASVSINNAGDHFYICTVGSHCQSGQKFVVKVDTGANNSSSALHD